MTGPPSPPRGQQNAPAAFPSDILRIPTPYTVERLEQNDDQLATTGDSQARVPSDAVLVLRSAAMDSDKSRGSGSGSGTPGRFRRSAVATNAPGVSSGPGVVYPSPRGHFVGGRGGAADALQRRRGAPPGPRLPGVPAADPKGTSDNRPTPGDAAQPLPHRTPGRRDHLDLRCPRTTPGRLPCTSEYLVEPDSSGCSKQPTTRSNPSGRAISPFSGCCTDEPCVAKKCARSGASPRTSMSPAVGSASWASIARNRSGSRFRRRHCGSLPGGRGAGGYSRPVVYTPRSSRGRSRAAIGATRPPHR